MNNTNNSCDFEQRVNRIKCEVKNCAYHSKENCCHASVIEVKPQHGKCECESDTICSTFKQL